VNTAYKHLDSKLRIAELTLGQWVGVIAGLAIAIVWGVYLSPLGSTLTTVTAVYIAALPAAAALFARLTEFNPCLVIRSAITWRRLEGRFIAGPGESVNGDVVTEEPIAAATQRADIGELDLASLWEED
jgi:hypothetical protein